MNAKLLSSELLAVTAQQAKGNPRLRQNYNFHALGERVQRFLNVLQPGTYVRPHCHRRASGFEFFVVLSGGVGVLLFEQGTITQTFCLAANGALRGLELPPNTFHTLVALTPDSAVLELKEGPYDPATDKEFLLDFPAEGTAEAGKFVAAWTAYFLESADSAHPIP